MERLGRLQTQSRRQFGELLIILVVCHGFGAVCTADRVDPDTEYFGVEDGGLQGHDSGFAKKDGNYDYNYDYLQSEEERNSGVDEAVDFNEIGSQLLQSRRSRKSGFPFFVMDNHDMSEMMMMMLRSAIAQVENEDPHSGEGAASPHPSRLRSSAAKSGVLEGDPKPSSAQQPSHPTAKSQPIVASAQPLSHPIRPPRPRPKDHSTSKFTKTQSPPPPPSPPPARQQQQQLLPRLDPAQAISTTPPTSVTGGVKSHKSGKARDTTTPLPLNSLHQGRSGKLLEASGGSAGQRRESVLNAFHRDPAIPVTKFSCAAQDFPGLYADLETDCKVFHMCQARGRMSSFTCPEGTAFDQRHLVCNWSWKVQCSKAEDFYLINQQIYS